MCYFAINMNYNASNTEYIAMVLAISTIFKSYFKLSWSRFITRNPGSSNHLNLVVLYPAIMDDCTLY